MIRGLHGASEDCRDLEQREVVGLGGAVLDCGDSLSGHLGPLGDLGLAQLELSSATGQ